MGGGGNVFSTFKSVQFHGQGKERQNDMSPQEIKNNNNNKKLPVSEYSKHNLFVK